MPSEARTVDGRLARIGERANPVLVKEIRSALRGRAFAGGFIAVLTLALVVSTIAMLATTLESDSTPSGVAYLVAVATVFGLGAHGLVPFAAMASMGAEHDEGALELLQLSGISPARLVLGKLGAAAVQAALIYAAFLPFLSFAFLLEGVDLAVLVGGVLASFVISLALSAFGIMLGAILRARWLRVLGYVVLAIGMIVCLQVASGVLLMRAFTGSASTVTEFLIALAITGLVAATCCVYATARLQHAEENRSTPFRVLGTVALVLASAFGIASGDAERALIWTLFGLGFALPSMMFGLTEPPRLPRVALARMRKKGLSPIVAPWMPGGGRAVLLVAANFAIALAAMLVGALIHASPLARASAVTSSAETWLRVAAALVAVEIWLAVVLLLPSGALARWLGRPWAQIAGRVAIVVFAFAIAFVPTFLMFLGGATSSAFDHAGNPAHFASRLEEGRGAGDPFGAAILGVALIVAVALNVRRVVGSFTEVKRARIPAPPKHVEEFGAEAQR